MRRDAAGKKWGHLAGGPRAAPRAKLSWCPDYVQHPIASPALVPGSVLLVGSGRTEIQWGPRGRASLLSRQHLF